MIYLLTKNKMKIKTQREVLREILKDRCDDVYDFLQKAQGGEVDFLRILEDDFQKAND